MGFGRKTNEHVETIMEKYIQRIIREELDRLLNERESVPSMEDTETQFDVLGKAPGGGFIAEIE